MSDHVRKQIRDYLEGKLKDLPTTGANVYVGRARPLPAKHDPALLIYMRREVGVQRTVRGAPPKIERPCTLYIEGRVSTPDVPDDLLDQIAIEVEQGMAGLINYGTGVFFGGLAQNVQFVGTELIADAEGDRHIGGVRLEYLVTYRTLEGDPSAVA